MSAGGGDRLRGLATWPAEIGADLQAVFSRRQSFAKRGKRSAIVGAEEGAIMSALLREAQGLGAGRDTAA